VGLRRKRSVHPSGVLVVDKPVGPTSHDIVAQARRIYETRTVGHAGTLDPLASGVLLLLLGEATKLSPHLTRDNKRYRATVTFGRSTDTLDREGTEVSTSELCPGWLQKDQLEAALAVEAERRQQVPPAFSAIKIQGRRAHRISRHGETVELLPREVVVHDLSLFSFDDRSCSVDLTVSKGYYVRSFARDLAASLGVPGHLGALRRLASGCFTIEEANPWPPAERVPPIELAAAAMRSLAVGRLSEEGTHRAHRGQRLVAADFIGAPPQDISAWVDGEGNLVALGEPREGSSYAVVRGFRRS